MEGVATKCSGMEEVEERKLEKDRVDLEVA
jgi:hypothetical protein